MVVGKNMLLHGMSTISYPILNSLEGILDREHVYTNGAYA